MDMDVVTFPALVVADDGWVKHLDNKEELAMWTHSALTKYSRRRVMLFDSRDHAWKIENIVPKKPTRLGTRFLVRLVNARVPVRVTVLPVTEAPLQAVRDALVAAIDADDDILTQFTEASDLKNAVRKAQSFESLLALLKENHAI